MSPVSGPPPVGNQLQAEVNRALDAEFGWGENRNRNGNSPDRNGSVVKGAGSVQVNRSSLVTLDGVHRQHSWRTEVVEDGDGEVDMGERRVMGGDVVEGDQKRISREGLLK